MTLNSTQPPRGRPVNVHILGDSLMVAARSESFGTVNGSPVNLINHSVGSRGLRHFNTEYLPRILESIRQNPGRVVIALGANDSPAARSSQGREQYAQMLRNVITQARQAGATDVTIMGPTGYNYRSRIYGGNRHGQMAILNGVYRNVAREMGVNFVEASTYQAQMDGARGPDGLHLRSGSSAFVNAITAGLNRPTPGPGPGNQFADAAGTLTRADQRGPVPERGPAPTGQDNDYTLS